jgi:HPt (histidine-containing phosphotransfer) domain-containing protein
LARAQHLVHTIKGLAGNLSALELQAASAQLETVLKHPGEDDASFSNQINPSFIAFETTLAQAINAARALIPEGGAKTPGQSASGQAQLPGEISDEAARRLREAAEMGDVAEIVAIADEMASRCDGFAPVRDRILSLADEFDFDGIIAAADQLKHS